MSEPNGTARWQLWVSAFTVGVVILGGMITLYVQVSTAYTTAEELKARVDRMGAQIAEDRLEISHLKSMQTESYTQLRASIDDENKGLAWQLRMDAMLWEQAFKGKSHFPTDNSFYPNIAEGKSQ